MNDDAPEAVDEAPPEALDELEAQRQDVLRQVYDAIVDELAQDNVITQRVRNLAQAAALLNAR